jgi:hypothetical protein
MSVTTHSDSDYPAGRNLAVVPSSSDDHGQKIISRGASRPSDHRVLAWNSEKSPAVKLGSRNNAEDNMLILERAIEQKIAFEESERSLLEIPRRRSIAQDNEEINENDGGELPREISMKKDT